MVDIINHEGTILATGVTQLIACEENKILRGADLCDADLRGADLRRADLCHADLRRADLCDANFHEATINYRGKEMIVRFEEIENNDQCRRTEETDPPGN
jgi:uncharacterized protein YjbI with pentapeptide repeats